MAKLTLADISGGYLTPANYNANNTLIENALENTLSRDGTSPNTMLANFDMNSNRIINLASPASSSDAARFVDVQDAVSIAIAPSQTGNADKFLATDGSSASWRSDFKDSVIRIVDDADGTKKIAFEVSGLTTGTTRTITVPDANLTLVGTATTQTLTNKTLTSPVISTISNTGTLTLPTSTDTLVGRNTTDTLTNKTLTAAILGGTTNVSGGQLEFPASQSASAGANTLDDYEEGTWTPGLSGGTPTYGLRTGTYTKIGRSILFQFTMSVVALGGASGTVTTGLPFTANAADDYGAIFSDWSAAGASMVCCMGVIAASGTTIVTRGATAAAATLSTQNIYANGSFTRGSGHYIV